MKLKFLKNLTDEHTAPTAKQMKKEAQRVT